MRVAFVLGTTSGGTGRHVLMLAGGLARRGHRVLVAGPRSVEEQFGFGAAGARFAEVRRRPTGRIRSTTCGRCGRPPADPGGRRRARPRAAGRGAGRAGGGRGAVAGYAGAARWPPRFGGVARRWLSPCTTRSSRAGASARSTACWSGSWRGGPTRSWSSRPTWGSGCARSAPGMCGPAVVPAPGRAPPRRTPARGAGRAGRRGAAASCSRSPGSPSRRAANAARRRRGPVAGRAPGRRCSRSPGTGRCAAELQRRIDAEELPVRLLGNRSDVPDLLAAADVAVWAEQLGGAAAEPQEALRAGRPLVATRVGGIPGSCGDAGGCWCPYGDVARAAERRTRGDRGSGRTAARLAAAAARRGAELPGEDDAVRQRPGVYERSDRAA